MKLYLTSAKCPRCGKQLKTSDRDSYSFFCKRCDEHFDTTRIKGSINNLFEVYVEMNVDDFNNNIETIRDIYNKYKCTFLEHNDCQLINFGWRYAFPDSNTLNSFIEDIEKIPNKKNVDSNIAKEELKKLLEENLKIYIDLNKNDGELKISVTVDFDGEEICYANSDIALEKSHWDYD